MDLRRPRKGRSRRAASDEWLSANSHVHWLHAYDFADHSSAAGDILTWCCALAVNVGSDRATARRSSATPDHTSPRGGVKHSNLRGERADVADDLLKRALVWADRCCHVVGTCGVDGVSTFGGSILGGLNRVWAVWCGLAGVLRISLLEKSMGV